MSDSLTLYMILLGCKPAGRNTEQHDIFFCIGDSLKAIIPEIIAFWPGAGTIHIDAWREVTLVEGFKIRIVDKKSGTDKTPAQLFFLNLGGYKPAEFEEFHYKILTIATDRKDAVSAAKRTAFYKHTGFKGAESHIDDKYGIDIDDIHEVKDILPENIKNKYSLHIEISNTLEEDVWHLGYTILNKIAG